ncbi:16S rRNA (cytosine(967)-C(5))-methyltransferase RsmB [Ruminococcus sp.]|uniref:16S rRNA (cytosine(967)-C(5))-methyltransferase RsmB n=1 Tax=Ruminococcus sp. TaxID=41978 RepID=UPI0025E9F3D8|nr:16S rRNA (cytosine(967)-C(5))-methyltransferase RsmB [Ruminococcus sp.]
MTDPRYLAVKLLDKTFGSGSYSNLQLDSGLKTSDLDERGRKLCSAVYYGVIERRITLDHIISGLSSRPIDRLDSIVLNILRCGVYQTMYMDSVPDSAAVNESVALAKKFRKTSASGMVNAVLRSFIRGGKELKLPNDGTEALSVKYSAPAELVKSLTEDYGREAAERFLSASLEKSVTYLRLNTIRCTEEEFLSALGCIEAERISESCFAVRSGDVTATDAFKKGFFHVQGLASQLCCQALAPTEQDRVLDICAAPGGKTFTMAELMKGRGEIYAFDLHEKRAELIRKGAERLGLTNIRAAAGDATRFNAELPKFTKILCDVPCSGLGVIGSKPEIKYKSFSDFAGLPDIQYKIVSNALSYLEAGGTLVYSTCTVRKAENEEICERLLREHTGIEAVELPEMLGRSFGAMATLMPPEYGSGFFISKFRKVR